MTVVTATNSNVIYYVFLIFIKMRSYHNAHTLDLATALSQQFNTLP